MASPSDSTSKNRRPGFEARADRDDGQPRRAQERQGKRVIRGTGSQRRVRASHSPDFNLVGNVLEDNALSQEGQSQDVGRSVRGHAPGVRGDQRRGRLRLLRTLRLRDATGVSALKNVLMQTGVGRRRRSHETQAEKTGSTKTPGHESLGLVLTRGIGPTAYRGTYERAR